MASPRPGMACAMAAPAAAPKSGPQATESKTNRPNVAEQGDLSAVRESHHGPTAPVLPGFRHINDPDTEATTGTATTAVGGVAKPHDLNEGTSKPAYLTFTPGLAELFDHLPEMMAETQHNEIWGVELKGNTHAPTANVLMKFLRANNRDVKAAMRQMRIVLAWRRSMNPRALKERMFSNKKYAGLGYCTSYHTSDNRNPVFTWTVYGNVRDTDLTFGDLDG